MTSPTRRTPASPPAVPGALPVVGAVRRANVLGVGVSAVNPARAVNTIEGWIDAGTSRYVTVTGVHGVMESQEDPELRRIHNEAGLVVPDGMPMVWMARAAGHRDVDRVYGPDLMLALMERSVARGDAHFLYGGEPGVAHLLADRLTRRIPGLRIAGTHTPPFRPLGPDELTADARRIVASGAAIVWIGLSTPKQERLMHRLAPLLDGAVLVGVGAAFDFHAGLKRQAPRWMQRSGLEWSYRMMMEPTRLGRRYLRNNPRFVLAILLQMSGLRRLELPDPPEGPVRGRS